MFKKKTKNKQGIRTLSATIDKETYRNVVTALDEALDDECINIGLVGPYGCGKSSAIKTYLSEREDVAEKTVFVSFGDYLESGQTGDGERFTKAGVERSIVEQILFSRKASKTNGSRIDRVHDTKRKRRIFRIVLGALFLVTFAFLAVFIWNGIEAYVKNSEEPFNIIKMPSEFWFPVVLALVFVVVGLLLVLCNIRDLKVKVSDVEIDCAKEEKSEKPVILNKYFDELLYFCFKNKIRLIVCEDIDRLEKLSRELFVDLRHLCVCLNETYSIKKKGKLSFVYCTNDAVFKNRGEMQKFFDCIIPIKPVLNLSNQESVVGEALSRVSGFEEAAKDGRFLALFSSFVTDMRILLSTINEYRMLSSDRDFVVEGQNEKIDLKERERLMLLCLYHNLYPDEFERLPTNDNEYTDFKKECSTTIENYRQNERIRLEKLINNQFRDLIILTTEQKLALSKALEKSRHRVTVWVNPNNPEISVRYLDGGAIDSFQNKDDYLYTGSRDALYRATVRDVEDVYGKDLYETIEKPFRAIVAKKKEDIARLASEIESLGDPITFAMDHPGEAFSGIVVTPLLKAMIVNGYFDDSSIDLLLYSEGKSSVGSLAYVKWALMMKDVDLTLVKLKNVESIVGKLDEFYFSNPEIINADMIEFFMTHTIGNDIDLKKKRLLDDLLSADTCDMRSKKQRLLFADLESHPLLIERLLKESPTVLHDIVKGDFDEKGKSVLQRLVIFALNKDIVQECLSEVVARVWGDPIDETQVEQLSKITGEFEKSGFKYHDITFAKRQKSVLKFVTSVNAWEINKTNLIVIFGSANLNLGEVKRLCADSAWCSENGVNGVETLKYLHDSGLIPVRKPAKSLFDLGLKEDDEIVFVNNSKIRAKVSSTGLKVLYKGNRYTLKSLLAVLKCKDYCDEMEMFTYNGTKLSELNEPSMTEVLTDFIRLLKDANKGVKVDRV